jgi:hypothetical protein
VSEWVSIDAQRVPCNPHYLWHAGIISYAERERINTSRNGWHCASFYSDLILQLAIIFNSLLQWMPERVRERVIDCSRSMCVHITCLYLLEDDWQMCVCVCGRLSEIITFNVNIIICLQWKGFALFWLLNVAVAVWWNSFTFYGFWQQCIKLQHTTHDDDDEKELPHNCGKLKNFPDAADDESYPFTTPLKSHQVARALKFY